MKKYYSTKADANKARQQRLAQGYTDQHVWRMPKGTRKAGWYAVCSEVEYLNTY